MAKTTPQITWKEAQLMQRDLDRTIHALEQAGLLREPDSDEMRTIAAESIADRFGERYRNFAACVPSRSGHLQIRRDRKHNECVLVTRGHEYVNAAAAAQVASKTPPAAANSAAAAKKASQNNWQSGILCTADEKTWKERLSRASSTNSSHISSTVRSTANINGIKAREAIVAPQSMGQAQGQAAGSANIDKDMGVAKLQDNDGLKPSDSVSCCDLSEGKTAANNNDGDDGNNNDDDDENNNDVNDLMYFSSQE